MVDHEKIEKAVRMILEGIGEDPDREGLLKTPARVARMYDEIFAGMHEDPKQYFETMFNENHQEMVLVKDIPLYSMCEHHLLPFYGRAHVAYIPNGRVVGLSKLARTVEVFAHRPQIQEQMTDQIADAIMEELKPLGAMVMVEAEHLCMTMRGVKKPGSTTVTMAIRGAFSGSEKLREQFLRLVKE